MFEYNKIKSVAKKVEVKGPQLNRTILQTMKTISDIVGATLGPGGQPVLIERFEHGLAPMVTKDGVTVFRSLGFEDPSQHCIMEAARDAAVRTASEAGDGPQPLWSKILTPSGFVEMRDIKVGMKICGTDGTVQQVVGVFPKGKKEILKVTFEQGQAVECCEDHLWAVVTASGVRKTITTKEIQKSYRTNTEYFTPSYKFSELKGYKYGIKISDVTRTGEFTEMQCIKVSNPDNLYITDDFIVTHNTTTATVLAEAIVRLTQNFCKKYPKISPQKVVRKLESAFRNSIEPVIKEQLTTKVKLTTPEGKAMLHSVAKISANGEQQLADAVMNCFDLVGDEGNVTITEQSGPSYYEVERIEGYPVAMGYEESCAKFYPMFVNDNGTQKCVLEKPVFVVYHGKITEIQTILLLMELIGSNWQARGYNHNVVLVTTGYSESVLGHLGVNFANPQSINVFPLVAPQSPFPNGQLQFLQDVCAITGAKLFDPLNKPIDNATLEELGPNLCQKDSVGNSLTQGVQTFEASRFRSSIIGHAKGPIYKEIDDELKEIGTYEDELLMLINDVQTLLDAPESELDKMLLQERLGKLTGGIAKLKVCGASNGELKEKRDRAEDAVCAVRGAIKYGCLPGGGWTLLKLMSILKDSNDPVITEVLCPALFEPVSRLLLNSGINEDEGRVILEPILKCLNNQLSETLVYDAMECKHVNPFVGGILDSTPAVLEAVRNSISIAALLGTLGGICVFGRDKTLEEKEALATAEWNRNAGVNEANLRP